MQYKPYQLLVLHLNKAEMAKIGVPTKVDAMILGSYSIFCCDLGSFLIKVRWKKNHEN